MSSGKPETRSEARGARSSQTIDQHIGQRLRARRLLLRLSEESLAFSLGVTPAQILNYEMGGERITASRLYDLSISLGVPIRYFFNDFKTIDAHESQAWLRDVDHWFLENISPHERGLLAQAKRMVGSLEAAKDLLHDAYAQILADDKWRSINQPRAYVKRIVFHLGLNKMKRERIVPMQSLILSDSLDFSDPAPDAFDNLSARQEIDLIMGAINQLPPRCRKVVTLRKLEGLSCRDIASQMGTSLSTVENQLARGLVLLGKSLDAHAVKETKGLGRTVAKPKSK